ncbi:MAG: hypothetical protein R6V45_13390 [Oceanipulchritudo sp.]
MKPLKPWGLSLLVLLSLLPGLELSASSVVRTVSPDVRLEVESEVRTMARGFETAFGRLPSGGKYVEIITDSGQEYLDGSVKSVEAMNGVLLITTERGFVYVINARRIAAITNEPPPGEDG